MAMDMHVARACMCCQCVPSYMRMGARIFIHRPMHTRAYIFVCLLWRHVGMSVRLCMSACMHVFLYGLKRVRLPIGIVRPAHAHKGFVPPRIGVFRPLVPTIIPSPPKSVVRTLLLRHNKVCSRTRVGQGAGGQIIQSMCRPHDWNDGRARLLTSRILVWGRANRPK